VNFQQLRIIRETLRHDYNLTEVANALFTSQSGVSKHIKDLEDELGVELFIRRGKRLIGLTEPGRELVGIVERILLDTQNIKKLGEQFAKNDRGTLAIATTHTQARYALPSVVAKFRAEFPNVHLVLNQGSPQEIARMLIRGEADIGVATETLADTPELVTFPYYSWHHGVIVPAGHKLDSKAPLTLATLAEWPIITYSEGFTGRSKIDKAFANAGIVPDIVLSALDADVIKAYVELGLGVGIVASMVINAETDQHLRGIEAKHLFETNTSRLGVRRRGYLRGFAYRFLELCSPALTEKAVKTAMDAAAHGDGH
jgi:LysR family cys regulon transcriptional activator